MIQSPDLTAEGQYVDAGGALEYKRTGHGPDGWLLLDPFFTAHIRDYSGGKEILDAGCGAAPWAIYAAAVGATAILAIDNSEQMLEQANNALDDQPDAVRGKVRLRRADVLDVPRPSESFGVALSINVGCALPSVAAERDRHSHLVNPLLRHFQEMARVLEPGGVAIVTAPASLEVPFTTFGDEAEKITGLDNDLENLAGESEAEMRKVVGGHADILRATIVPDGANWKLIRQAGSLVLGQPIHRKIPGLVVPNYNHSAEEYGMSIQLAGFKMLAMAAQRLPKDQYNPKTGLGPEYITSNPFAVYLIQKPAA